MGGTEIDVWSMNPTFGVSIRLPLEIMKWPTCYKAAAIWFLLKKTVLLNITMINIINQHWSRHWVYVQVQFFCFRVAVISTHRMMYLSIYLWAAYICVYIRGLLWWCIYSQTDKRSPTENPALDDIYDENDPAAPLSLCDSTWIYRCLFSKHMFMFYGLCSRCM